MRGRESGENNGPYRFRPPGSRDRGSGRIEGVGGSPRMVGVVIARPCVIRSNETAIHPRPRVRFWVYPNSSGLIGVTSISVWWCWAFWIAKASRRTASRADVSPIFT